MGDHRLGEQIKDRWHEACFKKVDAPSPTNLKKRRWEPTASFVSLKTFVRKLLKEGDQQAQDWLAHKDGSLNQPRSEANVKAAREAKAASKLARKSKKNNGSASSTTTKEAKGKGKGKSKGI
jgi:hypothetical protein